MDMMKLKGIRHLALDMDGTIYKGRTLFPFTRDFLARLESIGVGYTFLTNNSSRSRIDYLEHLRKMGIEARLDQLFTSTLSAMDYMRDELPRVRRLYVLGTPSLQREFAEAGYTVVTGDEEPDAVIAGFDTTLEFTRLCKAAWWAKQGKPYVATHPDLICPTDQPTVLVDCGAVCACIESATGKRPMAVLGKPDRRMLTGILERHNLEPSQLGMVGDRLYTDMMMANRAGAVGILVLTGEATVADLEGCPAKPDIVLPSIKELGDLLAKEKK